MTGGAADLRPGFAEAERGRVAELFWPAFGPRPGRLLWPLRETSVALANAVRSRIV